MACNYSDAIGDQRVRVALETTVGLVLPGQKCVIARFCGFLACNTHNLRTGCSEGFGSRWR